MKQMQLFSSILVVVIIICLLSNLSTYKQHQTRQLIPSYQKKNQEHDKDQNKDQNKDKPGNDPDMCDYLEKNYNTYTPYIGLVTDPDEPKPAWYYPEIECNDYFQYKK